MMRKTLTGFVVLLGIAGSLWFIQDKMRPNTQGMFVERVAGKEWVKVPVLDRNLAIKLAELPLSCILKKYPNKPGHVYADDVEVLPHHEKTPVFSGCFDWHSSVHMHWTLVRLLRWFPDLPQKARIVALLDAQFTREKVATEVAFFNTPHNRTFERIYGWAWLLRLHAELLQSAEPRAAAWALALAPLARLLRDRAMEHLEKLPTPVRPGTHNNTAFGMDHMFDYAIVTRDRDFEALLRRRALAFFQGDIDCPVAYEPSGVDFISPCLAEARLLSKIQDPSAFRKWFARFLAPAGSDRILSLVTPPHITDFKDYVIGHLVGLNFQRAWSYGRLATMFGEEDPRRGWFSQLRAVHLAEGLSGMDKTGYGGEHWLASFATFALTDGLEP